MRIVCRSFLSIASLATLAALLFTSGTNASAWSRWSKWSTCSASCDKGIQVRTRSCYRHLMVGQHRCKGGWKKQKNCYDAICPSYLGWPRIHFYGRFVASTPTTNNIRCYFNMEAFCPTCNTYRQRMALHRGDLYMHDAMSGNPMGNGHFYFEKTFTTAECFEPTKKCRGATMRSVGGVSHGRMVDLDPDWQEASQVIGYHLVVDGVLKALMLPAQIHYNTYRFPGSGDLGMSPNLKSKLVNVEWLNDKYKSQFKNSSSLSISFVLDNFVYELRSGRLTGTIGMTSSDDPVNLWGGRVMRTHTPNLDPKWEVPFNLDLREMDLPKLSCIPQQIVADLSFVVKSNFKEGFKFSTLKHVDFAVLTHRDLCKDQGHDCYSRALSCGGYHFYLMTTGGALDRVHQNDYWYHYLGGIVQLPLHGTPDRILDALTDHRVALVNRSALANEFSDRSRRLRYDLCDMLPHHCYEYNGNSVGRCNVVALENPFGLNFKTMGEFTHRLSRGQTWKIPTLVTSFGRPLQGARLDLSAVKKSNSKTKCVYDPKNQCDPYLSWPQDALEMSKNVITDFNGLGTLSVHVTRNIGHPRRCGLDGQIYPMGIIASYTSPSGVRVRVGDGGQFSGDWSPGYDKMLKQCSLTSGYYTFPFALKVFSSLSPSVMKKECPTWDEDIRPIFQFYYNMFPVMAQRDIINLRSIESVKSKMHLINMSMFTYGWNDANFMPTTRDLSPDKTEIVRRWIECEVGGKPRTPKNKTGKFQKSRHQVCGTSAALEKTLTDLRRHFQTAMLVELYTIPPYLTALFSLKRDRFKQVSKLLKSISTEEMLHFSLAANVLNSIGGSPNLTNLDWIPSYPTPFPSREFYELRPDLVLELKPFSKNLIKEVFAEIEKPASPEVYEVLHSIALFWNNLPTSNCGRWRKYNDSSGKTKFRDVHFDEEEEDEETSDSGGPRWFDVASQAGSKIKIPKSNSSSFWKKAFRMADAALEFPYISDVYSIGALYANLMLQLVRAEACVKLNSSSATLFTANLSRQLDFRQWYVTKKRSSAFLFPVCDLTSALEAAFEIVYEGEGSSPCSPFMTSQKQARELAASVGSNGVLDAFAADPLAPSFEKSHYVRFMEIAHGRELVPVQGEPPAWSEVQCLPRVEGLCGVCDSKNATSCWSFCFSGRSLDFEEKDGVWPLETVPFAVRYMNAKKHKLNKRTAADLVQFDDLYTGLLQCLERTLNGEPTHMAKCMGVMYELLDAGKHLATQPLYKNGDPTIGPNAAPRWNLNQDYYRLDGDFLYTLGGSGQYC